MKIEFTKGHGTGNDFILVLDKAGQIDLSADQVAAMCDRHFGIGADGLIIVKPTAKDSEVADLLDDEPEAVWFMDYRNSDGSRAEMCGNGIRVFARYLLENGLATLTDGSTLPVATRDGIKDLTATVNGFAVDLGLFSIGDDQTLVSAQGLQVSRPGLSVNVGNPHVVVALADLEELQGLELSKPPVLEPLPEDGANVEFVVLDEPLINKGVAGLTMRVHERGSGETMSCGTGIAASAIAIRHWAGGTQNFWKVKVPGGEVAVRMFPTEDGEHVSISGPAVLTYSGTWQD
jgi:diaminopimelate epimerase|tara:strand:+ start:3033 stop:3902 length:870 start_codon:yes stop_codon:yes gene_type:complete